MDLRKTFRHVVCGRPGQQDRPALPSGHPTTWGALTDGTVLDGAAYPHQVFIDRRDDEAHRRLLALAESLLGAD